MKNEFKRPSKEKCSKSNEEMELRWLLSFGTKKQQKEAQKKLEVMYLSQGMKKACDEASYTIEGNIMDYPSKKEDPSLALARRRERRQQKASGFTKA